MMLPRFVRVAETIGLPSMAWIPALPAGMTGKGISSRYGAPEMRRLPPGSVEGTNPCASTDVRDPSRTPSGYSGSSRLISGPKSAIWVAFLLVTFLWPNKEK
jgi:hypothetical protein